MFRSIVFVVAALLLVAAPALGDKDFDDLEKKLKHFDWKERLGAIEGLEKIGGEKAAKAIATLLDDEDWVVQIRALVALGALKDLSVTADVAKSCVEGEIILVRQAAAQALYDMAVPDVMKRLLKAVGNSRDDESKIHALEAAKVLATKWDVDAIAPHTVNRDMNVRAAAYRALGYTKSEKAVTYVLRGLRDKTVTVRVRAGEALGDLGGPEAMKGLVDLVLQEPDPYVMERVARGMRRQDAATAAEYVANRAVKEKKAEHRVRAVELLSELETEPSGQRLLGFLKAAEPGVRAWAARGLGRSKHVPAAAALEPLVLEDPDATVRRMALEAIVALVTDKDKRLGLLVKFAKEGAEETRIRCCVQLKLEREVAVVEDLYPLVTAEGWRVPTAAIIAIGALGHKDQIAALAQRAKDRDWRIRATVLEGLGQLRHMDVVPYLIGGLSDRDPVVKSAALKNLQILSQLGNGPDLDFWRKWYEKNKDTLELTKRGYREEVPDDYYGKSKYLIEILNRAQIVCVLGKWDHAEIVLGHLGIKTTIITPQKIDTVGLNPKQLMLINCEGSVGKKHNIERLQWFVHVGGYLMATDWALQNAVTQAFPGFLDRHSKSKTGNDVVIIEPADPDHPLLEGVFDQSTNLMWWLEVIAYPMKIADPFRCEILVDSLQMLQRYFSSPMAAVFNYGHGKVETCVSHFYLQEEGLMSTTSQDRKVFAADNLGISLEQIRQLESKGFFDGQVTEAMTKQIAEDYSMFRLIVNFVVEKRRQVEDPMRLGLGWWLEG